MFESVCEVIHANGIDTVIKGWIAFDETDALVMFGVLIWISWHAQTLILCRMMSGLCMVLIVTTLGCGDYWIVVVTVSGWIICDEHLIFSGRSKRARSQSSDSNNSSTGRRKKSRRTSTASSSDKLSEALQDIVDSCNEKTEIGKLLNDNKLYSRSMVSPPAWTLA